MAAGCLQAVYRGNEAVELLRNMEAGGSDYFLSHEKELKAVHKLDVSGADISSLPDAIAKLSNLQALSISGTNISVLPDTIAKLSNLQDLNISRTNISVLPDTIAKLSNLQDLNISRTNISVLPDAIANLSNLQNLFICGTNISVLPDAIAYLSNLQVLNISGTNISVLPDAIVKLSNLQYLDISETKISKLPDAIDRLANLQYLDIRFTNISMLPDAIVKLSNLQYLDISETKISKLPDAIAYLSNLQYLDISRTKITTLPPWDNPPKRLRHIDLSGLNLDELPEWLIQLGCKHGFYDQNYLHEDGINLHNTTLRHQPVSLFFQKREIIEAYLQEQKHSIQESKAIILGDGGVGKTLTLKRLLAGGKPGEYPTRTTHGVLIKKLKVPSEGTELTLNLWDFGGQQIMHSMHRCFLTDRTCYVIMVETRPGTAANYPTVQAVRWLQTIDSIAKKSPVIVITNQNSGFRDRADPAELRRSFPDMDLSFLALDVKYSTQEEFLKIQEELVRQIKRLDSYGLQFPERWYRLWQAIMSENQRGESLITNERYYHLCETNQVRFSEDERENNEIRSWLLDWFNDLGICFSYHRDPGNDHALQSYYLLEPEWLTNAVYLLICQTGDDLENVQKAQGIMSRGRIWDLLKQNRGVAYEAGRSFQYEEEHLQYIMDVLHKLKICYTLRDGREFFPSLLSADSSPHRPPDWFRPAQHRGLVYKLKYTHLPPNVIHRMMIHCCDTYKIDGWWFSGMRVVLDDTVKCAAVIASNTENELTIEIYSEGAQPYAYFAQLRQEIVYINQELGIQAKEYICVGTADEFEVNRLLHIWKTNPNATETGSFRNGSCKTYRIEDLLGLVVPEIHPQATDMEQLLYYTMESHNMLKKGMGNPVNIQTLNVTTGNAIIGDHNTISIGANVEELFQKLQRDQDNISEDELSAAIQKLQKSNEQSLKNLAIAIMQSSNKKRSFFEKIQPMLTDANLALTIGQVLFSIFGGGGSIG